MPTVTEIHNSAPIAQYLASNDISDGALFGKRPNPNLPIQIYLIRKAVEFQYLMEGIALGNTPSVSLTLTSNYLYSWCGEYGLYALALLNSGGIIPNSSSAILYGQPITSIYTAAVDGEYILNLSLPIGAIVIWAQKSIRTLTSDQYSYNSPNLTLLGGITLGAGEELFYEYVVPI